MCLLCRLWLCTLLSVWPLIVGHGMLCVVSNSGKADGYVETYSSAKILVKPQGGHVKLLHPD